MGKNGFSSIQNLDALTGAGFSDEQARAILLTLSQDSASREDLERSTTELKYEIKELDNKIEILRAELKRDIAELKRDIKELDDKMTFKMAAASAGIILTILSCLVTLGKLGLLAPATPLAP